MRPSEVLSRIKYEHAELRERMVLLETHLAALSDGEPSGLAQVLEHARGLSARLAEHVDLEDALLAPTLRAADAWGDQRASALIEHHRDQRRDIAALLVALTELSTHHDAWTGVELLCTVRAFAADLERDMRHEECELLDPDLLRDDVVSIAPEAG
jgi:iron-sulfur cluster repair protein YtfE (RIC family)